MVLLKNYDESKCCRWIHFFTISGYKNTNTKNLKEEQSEKPDGNSKREEGYFSFEIKVPTSQVILADHKVKSKSKNYGLVSLEFALLDESYEFAL